MRSGSGGSLGIAADKCEVYIPGRMLPLIIPSNFSTSFSLISRSFGVARSRPRLPSALLTCEQVVMVTQKPLPQQQPASSGLPAEGRTAERRVQRSRPSGVINGFSSLLVMFTLINQGHLLLCGYSAVFGLYFESPAGPFLSSETVLTRS